MRFAFIPQNVNTQSQEQPVQTTFQPGDTGQPGSPSWVRTQGQVSDAALRLMQRGQTTPMRPMDVMKDQKLEYVTSESIKLFNRAIAALPGDKFDGRFLQSWLQQLYDKALTCAWMEILVINGKSLIHNYAQISVAEVKQHAQRIQNEGARKAQNSEMLINCIKASITKEVYK